MYPEGLFISEAVTTLTPEFCSAILGLIDTQPWRIDLKRRTQHYGVRYDYTTKKLAYDVPPVNSSYGVFAIIRAITPLFHVLCEMYNIPKINGEYPQFQQVIVNEYTSKQSISPHTDSPLFGPIVMTVTIGDSAEFVMSNPSTGDTCSISPWNGCIVALCGESRKLWKHETKAVINPNFRRVSVTLRTIA